MTHELMCICCLKLESLHIKLNGEFILMKKILCMTQINEKFKMDGQDEGREDREACFKRLRKRRLGGSKEIDTGHNTGDPKVMESSMLKKCHYLENGSDL